MSTEKAPSKRVKRRAVPPESDTPFSEKAEGAYRAVRCAYRTALYALVPGIGLVLGPVAVLLGLRARHMARQESHFRAWSVISATLMLGLAITVTNWAGLWLIILGLRGS